MFLFLKNIIVQLKCYSPENCFDFDFIIQIWTSFQPQTRYTSLFISAKPCFCDIHILLYKCMLPSLIKMSLHLVLSSLKDVFEKRKTSLWQMLSNTSKPASCEDKIFPGDVLRQERHFLRKIIKSWVAWECC